MHTLEGIVRAVPLRLEFDAASGRFDAELEWHDSYEAEQHVFHYGTGAVPVCWTLVGYISGYASACLGKEVYFAETACLGQGAPHCKLVGMEAARWGERLESLRRDYEGIDLAKEVERRREAVHRQQQELARRERQVARREREVDALREKLARAASVKHFVAQSPAMREVLEMAARVAPLDTTVLVYGESGTGKEFVVRMIHEHSERAERPFVSVNCAALPETLLESELFGHVRGAFTGAVRDKTGLFELASTGTLFLDEIGEMAPTIQAKLLRALQEGEIRKVGGERNVRVNPRVVAATNRDLKAAVARGGFREDLYFRLGAFVIEVPPLRERREEIPALTHQFLRTAARRMKKDVRGLSAEAMTPADEPRLAGERARAGEHGPAGRHPRARPDGHRARAAARAAVRARWLPARGQPRHRPARAEPDRAGAPALPGQPPSGREGPQHQHRDPLAPHEALRPRRWRGGGLPGLVGVPPSAPAAGAGPWRYRLKHRAFRTGLCAETHVVSPGSA